MNNIEKSINFSNTFPSSVKWEHNNTLYRMAIGLNELSH